MTPERLAEIKQAIEDGTFWVHYEDAAKGDELIAALEEVQQEFVQMVAGLSWDIYFHHTAFKGAKHFADYCKQKYNDEQAENARLTSALEEVQQRIEQLSGERLDWYQHQLNKKNADNARLREALEHIAAPKYGLQGIVEDGDKLEEREEYWRKLAQRYEQRARAALAPSTTGVPG